MLQRLWRLRLLVALGILVAAVLAVLSNYDVSFSTSHPLHSRSSSFGAAHAMLYADSPRPGLVTGSGNYELLTTRAQVLARLVDSDDVKGYAARKLHVPLRDITVDGPLPDQPGAQQVQPVAQQRANQILSQGGDYSVLVDTEENVPTISLYTQAPNGQRAVQLANYIVDGLQAYVNTLARHARPTELKRAREQIAATEDARDRSMSKAAKRQIRTSVLDKGTVIRTTGAPVGGNVQDQTGKLVVILVFIAVLLGWCVMLLLVSGAVRKIRVVGR